MKRHLQRNHTTIPQHLVFGNGYKQATTNHPLGVLVVFLYIVSYSTFLERSRPGLEELLPPQRGGKKGTRKNSRQPSRWRWVLFSVRLWECMKLPFCLDVPGAA